MIKNFKLYVAESYASYFEQEKKKIIERIKTLIIKYNLEYILIYTEIEVDNDIACYVNSFNNTIDSVYLDYESHDLQVKFEKIENLSPLLLMKIWDHIEKHNLTDPAALLESLQGENVDAFKTILKKTKQKINFNPWIFELFWEAGNEKELDNELYFQDILFKTHPEAVESFLEAGAEILPEIVKRYPNIEERIENYNMKKNSKKYNL